MKLDESWKDPPLCTGMTKASLRMEGIDPFERKHLNIITSGSARLLLHFFRRMEGTPSGPVEEARVSWSSADTTSSISKTMLSSVSCYVLVEVLKNSIGLEFFLFSTGLL